MASWLRSCICSLPKLLTLVQTFSTDACNDQGCLHTTSRCLHMFDVFYLIWQDEQETKRKLASTDAKEIQRFYEHYCRKNLEEGLNMRKP